MAFLFKRNPKTPQELVRALNEQIHKLDDKKALNAPEECGRHLKQIKVMFYGDDETEVSPPDQVAALGDELEHQDSLYLLACSLRKLEFDSRQDASLVFAAMMRRSPTQFPKSSGQLVTGNYIAQRRPEIVTVLMKSSEDQEIGLLSGLTLRECCKYEPIAALVLNHPIIWHWFPLILQHPVFEVANDIFSTIKFCLTTHKTLALQWLVDNYEKFTQHINMMITSKNYVFKRSAMRFVLQLVQDRDNQQFLTRYFDDPTNLKVVMMNLTDQLRNMGVEAFNLFKYFVAKPKKNQKVLDILVRNKTNFIAFFDKFDMPSNDPNLVDEMNYVVKEIGNLPEIDRA